MSNFDSGPNRRDINRRDSEHSDIRETKYTESLDKTKVDEEKFSYITDDYEAFSARSDEYQRATEELANAILDLRDDIPRDSAEAIVQESRIIASYAAASGASYDNSWVARFIEKLPASDLDTVEGALDDVMDAIRAENTTNIQNALEVLGYNKVDIDAHIRALNNAAYNPSGDGTRTSEFVAVRGFASEMDTVDQVTSENPDSVKAVSSYVININPRISGFINSLRKVNLKDAAGRISDWWKGRSRDALSELPDNSSEQISNAEFDAAIAEIDAAVADAGVSEVVVDESMLDFSDEVSGETSAKNAAVSEGGENAADLRVEDDPENAREAIRNSSAYNRIREILAKVGTEHRGKMFDMAAFHAGLDKMLDIPDDASERQLELRNAAMEFNLNFDDEMEKIRTQNEYNEANNDRFNDFLKYTEDVNDNALELDADGKPIEDTSTRYTPREHRPSAKYIKIDSGVSSPSRFSVKAEGFKPERSGEAVFSQEQMDDKRDVENDRRMIQELMSYVRENHKSLEAQGMQSLLDSIRGITPEEYEEANNVIFEFENGIGDVSDARYRLAKRDVENIANAIDELSVDMRNSAGDSAGGRSLAGEFRGRSEDLGSDIFNPKFGGVDTAARRSADIEGHGLDMDAKIDAGKAAIKMQQVRNLPGLVRAKHQAFLDEGMTPGEYAELTEVTPESYTELSDLVASYGDKGNAGPGWFSRTFTKKGEVSHGIREQNKAKLARIDEALKKFNVAQ